MITNVQDAYIEITSACNLKCKHCYNDSGLIKPRREFTFNEIKSFAYELKKFNTKSIALSGGEPFLNPDIEPIIDYLCKEFELRIVSNFTCLDSYWDCIKRNASRLAFDVSLDGYDPDSYKNIRGANCFDKVISCIRHVKKLNVKKVAINCVMTPNIMHRYLDMIDVAEELEIPLTFSPMNLSGRALINRDLIITEEESFAFISSLSPEIKERYFQKYEVSFGCPLFTNTQNAERLKIANDGNVYLCQYFYERQFSLGNILSESLETILARSDNMLDKLKTYFNNSKCSGCFIKNSCERGCIALALRDNEFVTDGKCLARKKMCLAALIR